ncbi:MAG: MFS transporter [Cyanobacteria bacterium J06626_26]
MSPPHPDKLLTRATLLLLSTLTVTAGAIIAPSLPAMHRHFEAISDAEFLVRLALTMPALGVVIGSPIAGRLVDRTGRKPLLILSAILYGLAGGSGFVLNSLTAILASRALLGLAVAGVMVSSTVLIADYYRGDQRANFMGLQAAFMGLGAVVSLAIGGWLADLNWRSPFLIYLSAWGLLPMMVTALSEPLQDRPKPALNSTATIEKLPVKLLLFIYSSAFLMQIVFYLIPVQLPFYLERLAATNATQSGLAIATTTFFSALASTNYSRIKRRMGFVTILGLAFLLMGLGYIGIGLAHSYVLVLLLLVPTGLGLGLIIPNLNVWTCTEVHDRQRGRALGGLTTFLFLGQFLSAIASHAIVANLGIAATYGLTGILLVVIGVLLWIYRKLILQRLYRP